MIPQKVLTASSGYLPQLLPIRMIWLSGMFQLIGGGGATVVTMCYTIIGHVCSVEQRYVTP
jgi:hypothetical protein